MRKDLRQFFQAGNRVAGGRCAAYAFQQMNAAPKTIYLFLSSKKGFVAFCCILTKTQKPIDTIDTIGFPVFSMVS
jgi:hypothetical protein